MSIFSLVAAFALAATPLIADSADAATIVTGGNVSLELTYDIASHNIWGIPAPGAHPGTINEAGNPVLTFDVQASRYNRRDPNPDNLSGGSQVVDGGYNLYLNGGIYLFPTLGTPTRGEDGTISNELAEFAEDTTRLCCRHVLSGSGSGPNGFGLSTVSETVFGNLDGNGNRDPENNPDRTMFDLEANEDGTYNVVVTAWMASYLNYAYHPLAFSTDTAIGQAAWQQWSDAGGTPFDFAGGEVIGVLSLNVETQELAPVPVPAALPLLLGGLGLMGVAGKRRRKSADA